MRVITGPGNAQVETPFASGLTRLPRAERGGAELGESASCRPQSAVGGPLSGIALPLCGSQ